MNNEQENNMQSVREDDLFSGNSASVKPLFEEQTLPQTKPLFADSEPAEEAFIEQKLRETGPTAFAVPQAPAIQPEAFARPSEIEQPSYIPSGNSAPAEPVIVTSVPDPAEEFRATPPSFTPEQGLTATAAPDENLYTERKAPAPAPQTKQPRYGTIRTREAIIPASVEQNKRILTIDTKSATIGEIMRNARELAGMTIAQASERTCIKKLYITALENDDHENLPGGIFPSAYVRTLSNLYNLNDESRKAALEKVHETFSSHDNIPEKLIHDLEENAQPNAEVEQSVNKIFYIVVTGAAALLILLIAGIVLITISLRGSSEQKITETEKTPVHQEQRSAPVSNFDASKLETLTPPQSPALMRSLPVPSK